MNPQIFKIIKNLFITDMFNMDTFVFDTNVFKDVLITFSAPCHKQKSSLYIIFWWFKVRMSTKLIQVPICKYPF